MTGKRSDELGPTMKVIIGLAIAVTVVWGASLVVDMINPAYDPPANIGLVFMAVVSGLFGLATSAAVRGKDRERERERDRDKDDDEDKDEATP
ncbi:hypothetical protein SEA_ZIPP_45 [Gordonia phage Zipp]|uniref:Uncharacterized protein n=1 Tax=Gordonia phage Zipp TaxID=2591212 RepID=A0A514DHV8_9CAUD|nr:hypothetical protein J1775_gp45 [Gordonia phage Zipp]QDH93199.1 hypothetical protein SEA_ZIPP_45 [Gordonia phage Zipp]